MTRERMFGSDVPFLQWCRGHKDLPSVSPDCGISITDCDAIFHRYMRTVDSIGTREIQSIIFLEVKTRGGRPTTSQFDTLRKIHAFAGSKAKKVSCGKDREQLVRWWGVFFLSLSCTTPEDSDRIEWGIITSGESIEWVEIDLPTLVSLLRHEKHPVNFSNDPLRRHHKTRVVVEVRDGPEFLFPHAKPITKRS